VRGEYRFWPPGAWSNSIRATVRKTAEAKNTVQKLLLEVGAVCAVDQDKHIRDLDSKRLYQTLRVTPAMETGVTGRLWNLGDIVALLEAQEQGGSA
jgi:hypothetical protein